MGKISALSKRHGSLIAILAVGLLLRLWGLGDQSLWFDETYSVLIASLPWKTALEALLIDGVHPPLYYLLQKGVLLLGEEAWLLRLPSAIFSALSLGVIYSITRRWVGERPARVASLLLALSPFFLWYGREARMYAMLALLYCLVLLAYWRFISAAGRPAAGTLALFSAAAYLTHYFALMLPIIQLAHLALHFRELHARLRRWLLIQSLAFLPLLIWIAGLAQREGQNFGIGWIPAISAADLGKSLINLLVGFNPPTLSLGWISSLLLMLPILGAGLRVWRSAQARSLALLWAFLPLLLTFLMSLQRPLLVDRFLIGSLPGLLLLVAIGIDRLRGRWFWAGAAGVVGLMLINAALLFGPQGPQKENWRAAAARLEPADERVVVVARSMQVMVPLLHYASPALNFGVLETNRQEQNLEQLVAGYDEAWLVYWRAAADGHLLAADPPLDLAGEKNPQARAWITGQGPRIIDRIEVTGVTMFHFDLRAPGGGE